MSKTAVFYDAFLDFEVVAPTAWEYIPSPAYIPSDPTDAVTPPSDILLFTWTGAHRRYISKYISRYQTLFPHSRILVITTSAKDLCFQSTKRKQERFQPVIKRILEHNKHGRVHLLAHVFSEGGSNAAVELAEAYHDTTNTRLPISALCLDSTPGHPRFFRLCNGFYRALPPDSIVRHAGLVACSVLLALIGLFYCFIMGYENNPISKTWRRLLDSLYFDPGVPRCYLYSKTDVVVAWRDVQEHTRKSKDEGLQVTEVLFERSAHCLHARAEPSIYWDAVMMTWKKAVGRGMDVPEWDRRKIEGDTT